MRIVSIDVGIKNLGVCVMDGPDTIVFWDCIDIGNRNDATRHLYKMREKLEEISELFVESDKVSVLIENQPFCNPKMRTISSALHMFFVMKNIKTVILYSPKHKLKICLEAEALYETSGTGTTETKPVKKTPGAKYYSNKKRAIEACRYYISRNPTCAAEWSEKFKTAKKKDDLADSYLQGRSFWTLNKQGGMRKPTDQQLTKGGVTDNGWKYMLNQWSQLFYRENTKVPSRSEKVTIKKGTMDAFVKVVSGDDSVLEEGRSMSIDKFIELKISTLPAKTVEQFNNNWGSSEAFIMDILHRESGQ